MKSFSVVFGCGLACLCAFSLSLHAEDAARVKATASVKKAPAVATGKEVRGKKVVAVRVVENGGNIGILTEAYGLMEHADHDYNGHRAAAMRQVKEAARLVGQRIGARGGGHEVQGASDDQLRRAETLLRQASGSLSGEALNHVNRAVEQLGVALAVR